MTVVTRFAPSPTGYLHVGGARTALFAWLYARKMQGKFILRIEDTDLERSTQAAVDAILEGMTWLGLNYDEGPYFQTKRFDRYREVIDQMLQANMAYRCYCSKERLEDLRTEQMAQKQKPRYDGFCRHRTDQPDSDFVVRFKNPTEGAVIFNDLVSGSITFENRELDDFILMRSNGAPTYNFTVVVDDWDMQVTHVIRGADHINNTPRQINVLKALGATIPEYAHVPMILGTDGKKLSKRHGAVSVMQYRDDGFMPEALLNYLARLGWAYKDQEIFSIAELIQLFDIKNINRAPAAFNHDKLLWLNQHYLKTLPRERVAEELRWHFQQSGLEESQGPALVDLISTQAPRVKTLCEMVEKSRYFYESIELPIDSFKTALSETAKPAFLAFMHALETLEPWTQESIHAALSTIISTHALSLKDIAPALRLALTGGAVSPAIEVTVFLLGRAKTVFRLRAALELA